MSKRTPNPLRWTDNKGRLWKTFAVDFVTDGEVFSIHLMALSALHASLMIEDLRNTATLAYEIKDIIDEEE